MAVKSTSEKNLAHVFDWPRIKGGERILPTYAHSSTQTRRMDGGRRGQSGPPARPNSGPRMRPSLEGSWRRSVCGRRGQGGGASGEMSVNMPAAKPAEGRRRRLVDLHPPSPYPHPLRPARARGGRRVCWEEHRRVQLMFAKRREPTEGQPPPPPQGITVRVRI